MLKCRKLEPVRIWSIGNEQDSLLSILLFCLLDIEQIRTQTHKFDQLVDIIERCHILKIDYSFLSERKHILKMFLSSMTIKLAIFIAKKVILK